MIDRRTVAVHVVLRAVCSGCSRTAAIYSEDEGNFRFCRDCTTRAYTAACVDVAPLFLDVTFV